LFFLRLWLWPCSFFVVITGLYAAASSQGADPRALAGSAHTPRAARELLVAADFDSNSDFNSNFN
jgi:hypothetical protein